MSNPSVTTEKRIQLSPQYAERLDHFAHSRQISEDAVIERALDILFNLTDLLLDENERIGWSLLSESSLERVWNNDEDAAYDNWRELYGVSTG